MFFILFYFCFCSNHILDPQPRGQLAGAQATPWPITCDCPMSGLPAWVAKPHRSLSPPHSAQANAIALLSHSCLETLVFSSWALQPHLMASSRFLHTHYTVQGPCPRAAQGHCPTTALPSSEAAHFWKKARQLLAHAQGNRLYQSPKKHK